MREKNLVKHMDIRAKEKKAVHEVKLRIFEEVFDELGSKKGEKNIYGFSKRRQAKTKR